MTISKYCHSKGMTLIEYKNFESNIKKSARAIIELIKVKYADNVNNGMYYPINDILTYKANSDVYWFIIGELKKLGVEFIENCTYYRYYF